MVFDNDAERATRFFEALVRAAEGVLRDAINILGLSAQKALEDTDRR